MALAAEPADPCRFACGICFELLADPVTLTCGHSFDHHCLTRALAVGTPRCPACRAECPAKCGEVNTLFRDALSLLFPQQLERRSAELQVCRAEYAAQLARENAARVEAARNAPRLEGGPALFAVFQVSGPVMEPSAPSASARTGARRRRAEDATDGEAEPPPQRVRRTRSSGLSGAETDAAAAAPATGGAPEAMQGMPAVMRHLLSAVTGHSGGLFVPGMGMNLNVGTMPLPAGLMEALSASLAAQQARSRGSRPPG